MMMPLPNMIEQSSAKRGYVWEIGLTSMLQMMGSLQYKADPWVFKWC